MKISEKSKFNRFIQYHISQKITELTVEDVFLVRILRSFDLNCPFLPRLGDIFRQLRYEICSNLHENCTANVLAINCIPYNISV